VDIIIEINKIAYRLTNFSLHRQQWTEWKQVT